MRRTVLQQIRARPLLLERLRLVRTRVLGSFPYAERRPALEDVSFDWSQARDGIGVPPDLVFNNISVVPARRFPKKLLFDGGPVWPDFDTTPVVRHMRHDAPADVNATAPRRQGVPMRGRMIWGGRCFFHFGHLAAEHVSRLPGALYNNPDARVLFTLHPGKLVRDVPQYFWDMVRWLGVSPQRIHFVTRAIVAEQLHVSPQAEHISTDAPPDWYLDLLDELPRLHGLSPVPNQVLYVQRVGQLAKGNGSIAGEGALVAALKRAGVAVLDPEKECLRQQMALYAGARLLIFAEGSALHGRQLLGRLDQRILVLRRRPRSEMARPQLTPRCRSLEYASAIRAFAAPVGRNGAKMLPHGIAFLNAEALLAILFRHGVDLSPHWNTNEYGRHVVQDAGDWRNAILSRKDIDTRATEAAIENAFHKIDILTK